MDCKDVDRFLDHYLDGEFSEADSAALEEHLGACEGCRRLALAEVNLRRGIAAKLNPPQVLPAARRDSIIEGALARTSNARWANLFRPVVLIPASAGITLALVAALWIAWPGPGEYDHFIDDSIMAHESELPSEVEGDEAKIADFVRQKARFDARPPLRSEDARLVGARLTRVGTTPAVQYRYIVAGHPVTVVQTPAPPRHGARPRPRSRGALRGRPRPPRRRRLRGPRPPERRDRRDAREGSAAAGAGVVLRSLQGPRVPSPRHPEAQPRDLRRKLSGTAFSPRHPEVQPRDLKRNLSGTAIPEVPRSGYALTRDDDLSPVIPRRTPSSRGAAEGPQAKPLGYSDP